MHGGFQGSSLLSGHREPTVNSSRLKLHYTSLCPAMPWNRLPPPTEPKKRAFFSRPKVSWELVEQSSNETAVDMPASKTKIQVLPVDGSFQKKSEYQQQQEEQQQELLDEIAMEVAANLNSRELRVAECLSFVY